VKVNVWVEPVPAEGEGGSTDGIEDNGGPAWLKVSNRPPIPIFAVRGLAPEFGATEYVTVPSPVPVAGEYVSQGALDCTLQAQVGGDTAALTTPTPPARDTMSVLVANVTSHNPA
jgi:hypothetical protein